MLEYRNTFSDQHVFLWPDNWTSNTKKWFDNQVVRNSCCAAQRCWSNHAFMQIKLSDEAAPCILLSCHLNWLKADKVGDDSCLHLTATWICVSRLMLSSFTLKRPTFSLFVKLQKHHVLVLVPLLLLLWYCLYLLPWEPSSFLNLVLIHFDVSRCGDSEAANHEVGGHRPGLTGDVLNRSDFHTTLLLHLPPHSLLHRLPCRTWGEDEAPFFSSHTACFSHCREINCKSRVNISHVSQCSVCVYVCVWVSYQALWIQPDRRTCQLERPSSFPVNTCFHQDGLPAWWPLGLKTHTGQRKKIIHYHRLHYYTFQSQLILKSLRSFPNNAPFWSWPKNIWSFSVNQSMDWSV